MVTYEVNLDIEREVSADYLTWLKAHMDEIVSLEGFVDAQCHEVESSSEERLVLSVHYRIESREHLDSYFRDHAERLRGDGLTKFEGRFSAERRIYKELW